MVRRIFFGLCLVSLFNVEGFGQGIEETMSQGQIRGNFQYDMQYYKDDPAIGAQDVPEKLLTNGFLNLIYTNGNFSAGIRYESYLNALLGYPVGYKGSGIVYRYASFKQDKLSVTVGNFYEQFGNGLIFRTYESRGLGYDNAMDGVRVKYELVPGLVLTGLTGKQRLFFDYGEGIVRGFDADLNINKAFNFTESKTKVIIGGSSISKFQEDKDSRYLLPQNVAAFSGRFNVNRGKISVSGEYAYKANDPSADNGFIYKSGEAIFLQTSYSQKGFGLVLAAKRNDNMSFRSDRTEGLQNLLINYLPALTKQHTYNLLATLYPYATQLNGELAYQADLIYKFKKESFLGGKNGMDIQANFSSAFNIDTTHLNDESTNRKGYTSTYFKTGRAFFRDLNFQIDKKFSSKVKGRFTYANLFYNQETVAGKPGKADVKAHVGIADVTYKFNMRNSLRTEAQVLTTKQDQGDWATLLFEYSYSPHWFVAILDQYNYGNKLEDKRLHYYNASMGYNNQGNRITVSYGRQRAGIFCVGGVCREVPASNGLYISITSSF